MATDYDAPRETSDEAEESVEALKARHSEGGGSAATEDEPDAFDENFELPGADLSGEELRVQVVPKQRDEFTCSRCFLVHHRTRLAEERGGQPVCSECA